MGREKTKFDYLIEYGAEIKLLSVGFSLREVRRRLGHSVNTLRKLRRIFKI